MSYRSESIHPTTPKSIPVLTWYAAWISCRTVMFVTRRPPADGKNPFDAAGPECFSFTDTADECCEQDERECASHTRYTRARYIIT